MPANCDIFIDIVIEMDFEEPHEQKERIKILQRRVQVVQQIPRNKMLSTDILRNDSGYGSPDRNMLSQRLRPMAWISGPANVGPI